MHSIMHCCTGEIQTNGLCCKVCGKEICFIKKCPGSLTQVNTTPGKKKHAHSSAGLGSGCHVAVSLTRPNPMEAGSKMGPLCADDAVISRTGRKDILANKSGCYISQAFCIRFLFVY